MLQVDLSRFLLVWIIHRLHQNIICFLTFTNPIEFLKILAELLMFLLKFFFLMWLMLYSGFYCNYYVHILFVVNINSNHFFFCFFYCFPFDLVMKFKEYIYNNIIYHNIKIYYNWLILIGKKQVWVDAWQY